jgi:hypothetical protein
MPLMVWSVPLLLNTLKPSALTSEGGFTSVHSSTGPLAGPFMKLGGPPMPSGSGKTFG